MCAQLLTLSLTVHCALKLLLTGRKNSEINPLRAITNHYSIISIDFL